MAELDPPALVTVEAVGAERSSPCLMCSLYGLGDWWLSICPQFVWRVCKNKELGW